MIDYALAKELKDAGFPQMYGTGKSYYSFPDFGGEPHICTTTKSMGDWADFHEDEGDVYLPTLEELIEACGERFMRIQTNSSQPKSDRYKRWGAYARIKNSGEWPQPRGDGTTPSEAVALLYIALKKKE